MPRLKTKALFFSAFDRRFAIRQGFPRSQNCVMNKNTEKCTNGFVARSKKVPLLGCRSPRQQRLFFIRLLQSSQLDTRCCCLQCDYPHGENADSGSKNSSSKVTTRIIIVLLQQQERQALLPQLIKKDATAFSLLRSRATKKRTKQHWCWVQTYRTGTQRVSPLFRPPIFGGPYEARTSKKEIFGRRFRKALYSLRGTRL